MNKDAELAKRALLNEDEIKKLDDLYELSQNTQDLLEVFCIKIIDLTRSFVSNIVDPRSFTYSSSRPKIIKFANYRVIYTALQSEEKEIVSKVSIGKRSFIRYTEFFSKAYSIKTKNALRSPALGRETILISTSSLSIEQINSLKEYLIYIEKKLTELSRAIR